ncbi:MAG: hypothetical protein WCH76_02790 [Candidatus Riflemargulisbacteria bacterium]
MIVFLGFLNVALLFLTVFLFLGKKINEYLFKGKSKLFKSFVQISHHWHIYTAIMLILTALLHGYLALDGQIYFHSGYVLFLSIIFAIIGGISFKILKNKNILQIHKLFAVIITLLLIWHILSVI